MSTEYIHFTTEQREAARQTDLVALLQSQGEQLKRSGKEYVWHDGSEKVTLRGHSKSHPQFYDSCRERQRFRRIPTRQNLSLW